MFGKFFDNSYWQIRNFILHLFLSTPQLYLLYADLCGVFIFFPLLWRNLSRSGERVQPHAPWSAIFSPVRMAVMNTRTVDALFDINIYQEEVIIMTTTIDQAFVKQFEREVHEAFQRQGSKLRNTVRVINEVQAVSYTHLTLPTMRTV